MSAGGFTLLLALLLFLGLGQPAEGQTNVAGFHYLSLTEAFNAALLNNRILQIERINPEIAGFTLRGSYGVYDPLFVSGARRENVTDSGAFDPVNPALNNSFSSESEIANAGLTGFLPSGLSYSLNSSYAHSSGTRNFLNFDSYRVVAGIYLQQPLLKNFWIDSPRLNIRVNKRNLAISEQGVRWVTMNVFNQVHQGYYDLLFAWENLRVLNELRTTRQEFLQGMKRQLEVGTMTTLEESLAQAQLARVETDLVTASNVLSLAGNQLKLLMGMGATNWTESLLLPVGRLEVSTENFDLTESWKKALAQRPDFLQLNKSLEKAELIQKYRQNQLLPSLDLIGSYGRRGSSSIQAFPPDNPSASSSQALDQFREGDAPNDMVGLVFSIPLSRRAEKANYQVSKSLKRQAELLVKQKEEEILREIADAIQNARFGLDRVNAAKRAREFAESALKGESEKLLQGKSAVMFVLQSQGDLAGAQTTETQARQLYNKALIQLRYAEGAILDGHSLSFGGEDARK